MTMTAFAVAPSARTNAGSAPPISAFFSQNAELRQAVAAADPPLPPPPHPTPRQSALMREYNRLGGLIARIAGITGVPLPVALAIWFLESSGRVLVHNQAIIRFEVHHFWSAWGHANAAAFDAHFRFGGHCGCSGHPWEGHAWRDADGPFAPVHSGQSAEYAALRTAMRLAGEEDAVRCLSIGGCQLLCCDYPRLGYASALAMYNAFQASENAQVLGFFDFCAHQPTPRPGELLAWLRDRDFASFAHFYNGGGEVAAYAAKLKAVVADAEALLRQPAQHPPS